MDRRSSLKLFALAPLPFVAGCQWTRNDVEHAHDRVAAARAAKETLPPFFTDHERATVDVLVDLILPADDRSGSATDLKVPEFMDFIIADQKRLQTPVRGGLAWLDTHTRRKVGKSFVEASDAERRGVLDEIAYPYDFDPSVAHGVAFFNLFRDLTASGFWSTKEGMEDVGYRGNQVVTNWTGAPQAEMDRLGLTFDDWPVA